MEKTTARTHRLLPTFSRSAAPMALSRRRVATISRRLPLPLLLFFSFNSLVLLYYFFFFPSSSPHRNQPLPPPPHRHQQTPSSSSNHRLKPWPHLPSFLPWSHHPLPTSPPRSCESLFGNGFSRRADALRGHPGWFRCLYNDALRSSVCEGGSIRMDPRRISMSRGGERLEDVMGRGEDEELPRFEDGAFQIAAEEGKAGGRLVDEGFLDEYVPRGAVGRHSMRELIAAIRVVALEELECEQWIDEPSLLVIRFEYANMFHTMSDWYSAYVSSRVADLPYRPKVVFVDGHCKEDGAIITYSRLNDQLCAAWLDGASFHFLIAPLSLIGRIDGAVGSISFKASKSIKVENLNASLFTLQEALEYVMNECDGNKAQLEQTWEAIFSGLTYAKNFTGPVCFRHAILSPLGYETAMFKGLSESFSCHGTSASELRVSPDDRKTARLTEFGEMIRAVFDLPVDEKDIKRPISSHNVLFVRRENYVAHPRHNGKVESRLSNEQEVFSSLQSWASGYTNCKINLVNGLFSHMPMRDQVQVVQEASVVIGAHGAGLIHAVSARSDTVVLEIISSFYRRPHFELISEWKGLRYHAINLAGSYAEPQVVIDELRSIMQSLGC